MINIFEPNIPLASLNLLDSVFKSKWLGRGKLANQFEENLSTFTGLPRSEITTMSCCTDAIFAILPILKRHSSKKKVLVPSISFPAVASSVVQAGLELVIVDTDPKTGNISHESIKKNMDNDVLAIFLTHYGGNPVDVNLLRSEIGSSVYILEDSACALGSVLDSGHHVGSQGDFSCWSFDAMKLLVAGEGGAARLSDTDLLIELKQELYLGLPASDKSGLDKSEEASEWWSYNLTSPGRRSVFTDVNAAIGLPQFTLLDNKLIRKQTIRDYYLDCLRNTNIGVVEQNGCKNYSNYFFTVQSSDRNKLAYFLKENGVYTTFRYYPLHKQDIFSNSTGGLLNGSNYFSENSLNIPIHDTLSEKDINKIADLLSQFK